ncbi:MAG: hypothetical protein R3C10_07730 [Pirellulales bacterium]
MLDAYGNWSQKKVDAGTEYRTYDNVDEIALINRLSYNHRYDDAGNMTEFPQPDGSGTYDGNEYGAWNRLVTVNEGMSNIATTSMSECLQPIVLWSR